jgi:hypothetical protein
MIAGRLLLLTLAAQAVLAQTPPEKLVTLDLFAHDAHGVPVTDLRPEEIRITDSGRHYPIVHFRAATATDAFPHAVVVVVDQIKAREKLTSFTWDRIGAAMRAQPSGSHLYLYVLTTHRSLLPIHAIPDSWVDAPLPDPAWARESFPSFNDLPALDRPIPKSLLEKDKQGMRISDRLIEDTMQDLAARLAGVPGPRSIVWIGAPADGKPVPEKPGNTLATTDGALIDPIHIYSVGAPVAALASVTFPNRLGWRWSNEPRGDIPGTITHAVADARRRYRVAYLPPPANWDGRTHDVHVSCTRHGVAVEARPASYAAPKLNDLLADQRRLPDLLPLAALDSTLLRLKVGDPASDLVIDARDVVFLPQSSGYTARLIVQTIHYSSAEVAEFDDPRVINFTLTAAERDAALRDGLHILNPSRAPVRIVVADLLSGAFGTLSIRASR